MGAAHDLAALNPFPGLRAFATSEAGLFFGRGKQIDDVVARLGEVSLVAVAGSSGCGKSSLVLAGVLSALERRSRAGGEIEWRAVVMRPGNHPITNLAQALARVLHGEGASEESRAGSLYGELQLGGLGLVEAVRFARLGPHVRLLVVVDQFEEIFRYKRMTNADEASAFVKLLLNAADDVQSPVRVIITLRSDTLGYLADFYGLPEAVNRGQYLVPKLTREQRKEAIVSPVELRGHKIAPRLVQRLLNDVSDDFDDLPVMQHVLARTWNHWAATCQGSRPIDLEDYEAVGTATEALSQHADEAYHDLQGLEAITEKVFRALTERGPGGVEQRRPLEFELLCDVIGGDRAHVEQVFERYRRPDTGFLMPPRGVPLESNPVDISHESLIRRWKRLREWSQAEAESRAMILRLVEAAQLYERKEGSLWQGPALARAREWQQRAQPTEAWVGLYTGGDGKDAWQSAKNFLAESAREVGRARRKRALLWLIVPFAAISLIAIFFIQDLLQRAKSNELASKAFLAIEQDPARSAHLAVAALTRDPKNGRGDYALRQSLANLEIAYTEKILEHGEPVVHIQFSRDGSRFVTASGNTVRIYDAKSFEKPRTLTAQESVLKAWLVANNNILVTHMARGEVRIQPLESASARRLSCESGADDAAYTVSVSPDERYIAVGCRNGSVRVWNLADPAKPTHDYTHMQKDPITVTALAFSADSQYVASGDQMGVVKISKVGTPELWTRGGGSGKESSPISRWSAVRDLGFHPGDPGLLVAAADDGTAVVWKLDEKDKNEKASWHLRHQRPVVAAKFAIGPNSPVITVSDKTVRIWENETVDPTKARGHDDFVIDANASDDGELLVTASADGTARVWSMRSGGPIAILRGHRSAVSKAVFAPGGRQVATASEDGSVRIWRIQPVRVLWNSRKWMLGAAFAPGVEANRVAVGGEGQAGTVELAKGASPEQRKSDFRETAALEIAYPSWSRDGQWVVGYTAEQGLDAKPGVKLWRADSGKEATPDWLKKWWRAAFSVGTDELVTLGPEGAIAVWAAKSVASQDAKPIQRLGDKLNRAVVAISPDGKWIASDGKENTVELWKRDEPQAPARELKGHMGQVTSAQFSRDSKWLVTASRDRTACIWPVNGGAECKKLDGGHTAALFSAAFDSEGKRVITASADNTMRVWNADTGAELVTLRWHAEAVNDARFSPDGTQILSASDDGTVKLGRCETCLLSLPSENELRQRVRERATLSEAAKREVELDTAVKVSWMPAFLTRWMPAFLMRDK